MERMITEDGIIEQSTIPISEDSLMSLEKLDRASPDLWPEESITRFIAQNISSIEVPTLSNNLTSEDMQQIYNLGRLTLTELILEVKSLHDTAYKLGLEEAKEMTRGKYLNIFKQK